MHCVLATGLKSCIANKIFVNTAEFKYVEKAVTQYKKVRSVENYLLVLFLRHHNLDLMLGCGAINFEFEDLITRE
jgi:hypothetical protein